MGRRTEGRSGGSKGNTEGRLNEKDVGTESLVKDGEKGGIEWVMKMHKGERELKLS